jgi:hypothetical protein
MGALPCTNRLWCRSDFRRHKIEPFMLVLDQCDLRGRRPRRTSALPQSLDATVHVDTPQWLLYECYVKRIYTRALCGRSNSNRTRIFHLDATAGQERSLLSLMFPATYELTITESIIGGARLALCSSTVVTQASRRPFSSNVH